MPKLDPEQRKTAEEAEGGSFLLEPGRYVGTLKSVEVKKGNEAPYWSWTFGDIVSLETGEKHPGSQWVNTSLSEKAAWKVKEMFDAFGYTLDSDTDEMVGDQAVLVVSQRVIEKGARAGQLGNNVDSCLPYAGDEGDSGF